MLLKTLYVYPYIREDKIIQILLTRNLKKKERDLIKSTNILVYDSTYTLFI